MIVNIIVVSSIPDKNVSDYTKQTVMYQSVGV